MKIIPYVCVLMMLCLAGTAVAQRNATAIADSVSMAYDLGKLRSLDRKPPYNGKFSVTIEHSISGDLETRSFASFAAMEAWLKKREHEGLPRRVTKELERCSNNICTFDTMSILHNHLYLQRITMGTSRGKLYIKSIRLLDGD